MIIGAAVFVFSDDFQETAFPTGLHVNRDINYGGPYCKRVSILLNKAGETWAFVVFDIALEL